MEIAMNAPDQERRETIEMIRQSVAALGSPDDLSRVRRIRFTVPGFDLALWREACALGWPGLLVSQGNGGAGFGFAELAALLVECGRALVPEPVGQIAIVAPFLPQAVQQKTLAGEMIVPPALFEGADDDGDGPKASFDGGFLSGTKHFVDAAEAAGGFLVSTAAGLAYVEADQPGVTIAAKTARDGSRMGTITFRSAVAIPVGGRVEDLVDGFFLAEAAYLLGAMSRLFDMTLQYIKTRKQFEAPLGSFQALQHRSVDLLIQRELARAVLERTIAVMDGDAPEVERRAQIARLKARIGEGAMRIVQDCVQMHGAIGVTDEYDGGLFVRRILTRYNLGGSARAHRSRAFQLRGSPVRNEDGTVPISVDGLPEDYNEWEDDVFRLHVRHWLEANYPPELRYPTHRLGSPQTKVWYDRLSRRGWLAPAWPREHGGMGLHAGKHLILVEEFERHGCARYSDHGVLMIGPLLMKYGTPAQRDYFLPRIITGEHIWAQGYSEPGSGSDLASLRTSAVLDGDEWVVNGQKIWTTRAQDANWLYALVRTATTGKKQEGISFLLIPLDSPGVTVRPIKTLCMDEEFCEVFLDDVRVPKDALVGELSQGWGMAKTLLGFERIFVGSPAQSANAFNRLETLLACKELSGPDIAVQRAELAAELADHSALYEHFADKLRRGDRIGPDVSMLKINQTELFKRICRAGIDLAGADAGASEPLFDTQGLDPSGLWFMSLQSTIYGGSSEIQRNILAKEVLGLR